MGLNSLTELNLRRNRIEHVYGLNFLPALQRLFLSGNSISAFENVRCIFKVKFLFELTLDNNPVAAGVASPQKGEDSKRCEFWFRGVV